MLKSLERKNKIVINLFDSIEFQEEGNFSNKSVLSIVKHFKIKCKNSMSKHFIYSF